LILIYVKFQFVKYHIITVPITYPINLLAILSNESQHAPPKYTLGTHPAMAAKSLRYSYTILTLRRPRHFVGYLRLHHSGSEMHPLNLHALTSFLFCYDQNSLLNRWYFQSRARIEQISYIQLCGNGAVAWRQPV